MNLSNLVTNLVNLVYKNKKTSKGISRLSLVPKLIRMASAKWFDGLNVIFFSE